MSYHWSIISLLLTNNKNMFGFGKPKFDSEEYERAKVDLDDNETAYNQLANSTISDKKLAEVVTSLTDSQKRVEKMQDVANTEAIEKVREYREARREAIDAVSIAVARLQKLVVPLEGEFQHSDIIKMVEDALPENL